MEAYVHVPLADISTTKMECTRSRPTSRPVTVAPPPKVIFEGGLSKVNTLGNPGTPALLLIVATQIRGHV